jgi:hypothetical protein
MSGTVPNVSVYLGEAGGLEAHLAAKYQTVSSDTCAWNATHPAEISARHRKITHQCPTAAAGPCGPRGTWSLTRSRYLE